MADHLEILVEELSMEAALQLIVPKLIGDASFQIYPHQCKEDLLRQLPQRLRGYAAWLPAGWQIIIVIDRDNDECRTLKNKLESIVTSAGLKTRNREGLAARVVNRLAIEELEAWFFGDWEAVRAAYPKVSANVPNNHKFRDPDAILGGTWEALERVFIRHGYFKTGLRKIEAARAIARHMVPERNRSKSFQMFRDAVVRSLKA